MVKSILLVSSPEAAKHASTLFADMDVRWANGKLPEGDWPNALAASTDPEWIASICPQLAAVNCAKIRQWLVDLSQCSTFDDVKPLTPGIKPYVPVDAEKALDTDDGHTNAAAKPTDSGSSDEPVDQPIERDVDDFEAALALDHDLAAEHFLRSVQTSSAIKSAAHEEAQSAEWGDPADFWSTSPPIPFDPQWIMPTIRPFVLNQAAMVGCDAGLTYLQALGFAAGCLSDDIRVRVRPLQDWAESARLWVCVVGEPGDGKSPSMRGIMRESRELNMEIAEASKHKAAVYKDELELHEMERKAWLQKRQNMDASKPAGPRPIAPSKPVNEMLYFNSTTSEGLLEQQEATTRGTMLYADEMLGWIFGMDQYKASGKGNDKQFWLSSWDGAEFIGVLVGKLRTIPNTGVTIIGGSQPTAIRRASTKLNLDADGLLQRIIVYNSQGDADEDAEQPLDRDAAKRWRSILRNLYHMKTHLDHCVFSDKAHAVRGEANDWIKRMREVTAFPIAARQAISKWKGYLPRLALTLHAIEAADAGLEVIPATIEEHTISCAWEYMRNCLWPHTLHFYNGLLDFGDETASTRVFAEFVLARDIRTIKPHILTSTWSHYRRLKTISERKEFWARVEQAGWVRPCGTFDRAGGISREYEINPAAFDGRFEAQISSATEAAERYRQAMHPAMRTTRQPGED